MSSVFNSDEGRMPFEFGNLRRIKLDLRALPDSWIDGFIAKNQQLEYLSLNIKSDNACFDENVLKMKKTLPNLRSLELIGASTLKLDTIIDLLRNSDLVELLMSGLNTATYDALKVQDEIKKMAWRLTLFSKFTGAKFERHTTGN